MDALNVDILFTLRSSIQNAISVAICVAALQSITFLVFSSWNTPKPDSITQVNLKTDLCQYLDDLLMSFNSALPSWFSSVRVFLMVLLKTWQVNPASHARQAKVTEGHSQHILGCFQQLKTWPQPDLKLSYTNMAIYYIIPNKLNIILLVLQIWDLQAHRDFLFSLVLWHTELAPRILHFL